MRSPSQSLFDDLSPDPEDWAIAIAAEGAERIPTAAALISRPFDYGTVISYSFDSAHWQATRYSDGTAYGVWYGSLDVETTVHETAWHWYRFVTDSCPAEDREIRTERRVFDVRCDGTNAAVFKPERLSNVRDRMLLTYRLNAARDTFVAERTPGRKWIRLAPSSRG